MKKLALLTLLVPSALPAQEYQLRLLTHAQWQPAPARIGLAGWAVLPNVMNEGDPWRTLLLGGALLRNERRWVEVMGGALLSEQRSAAAVLNVRYLERRPRGSFFLEGEYTIPLRRVVVISNAVARFSAGPLRLGAGVEGEWIHARSGDIGIAGPRLSIALPLCGRLCRDAALTTAFRMHSDGHRVVRQYFAINF